MMSSSRSTAALGPIFLGQSQQTVGSSSFGNVGNTIATDYQSVTLTRPLGTTWQATSIALCPPLTTQTITPAASSNFAGNGNTSQYDIYRNIVNFAGTVYTETGNVCVFGGSNMLTPHPANATRVDQPGVPKEYFDTTLSQLVNWVIPSHTALDALGPATKYIYLWIYPNSDGPDDQTRQGQWTRYCKWKLAQEHHCLRPFASMHEALMRAEMAHTPSLDAVNSQAAGYLCGVHKAFSDPAHVNAESYYWVGVYHSKINKALYGGVPFVPTYPIVKKMTGPGLVANLRWFSSDNMANCTFSVDDPNFTVTKEVNGAGGPYNAYNLALRLVGAVPTEAPKWLNLTITKFDQSETWRLPVTIDSQVAGDHTPYPVTVRQVGGFYRGSSNTQDNRDGAYFTSSSTQLTVALALKAEQIDALQRMFRVKQGASAAGTTMTAGTGDTTSQVFWRIEQQTGIYKLHLRKTGAGQLQFQLWDDSATPIMIFNHATPNGTLTISKGLRFFMFTFDTADATACKFHASAGKDILTNIDYPAINETITMAGGGNGNIALNHQTSSTTADMRLFQDVANMPSVFFTATVAHIWVAQALVPNEAASWDLFFDEAAQKARTYPVKTLIEGPGANGDGRTWRGIVPYMSFKGKAAKMVAGCDDIPYTDLENGHKQWRNDGTGPSLLLAPMRPPVDQPLTYF
jgi:hypothetical protein